jgi:hypothetical protein
MDNTVKYTSSSSDGLAPTAAAQQKVEIHLNAARRFLHGLDPHSDKFTFQTFDDRGKRRDLARILHGTLDEHTQLLAALNGQGAGIFVTINETDFQGRTAKNIRTVRAVFADFDDTSPESLQGCPLVPHIGVMSSPSRWHAYWLVAGLPLDQFSKVQRAIAARYGSDSSVNDVSRVMRLPGFLHLKTEPFLSELAIRDTAPYTAQQVLDAFLVPTATAPPTAAVPVVLATVATVLVTPTFEAIVPPQTITDLRRALCSLNADDRDLWIAVAHDLFGLGNTGRTLWLEWSQQSKKYDAKDAAYTWASIRSSNSDYRTVFTRAQAAGWLNPLSNAALVAPLDLRGVERDARAPLPSFAEELLALPHGLGAVQQWILGTMKYPSRATAGVTALALLTHCAMSHVTIASYDGLGLNEQYMILAPTGFGKEDTRKPFGVIARIASSTQLLGAFLRLPRLQYSAPASQQGLHDLLQQHSAQTFLSDEFGDWLAHSEHDLHKKAALGHFMQAYTKATTTLATPHAVTRQYTPVEKPRVLVFATSTPERMMEALTLSQAESGALNRFVMLASEQDRIEKQYDGQVYEPSVEVIDILTWILSLPESVIRFSPDAWAYFTTHDRDVIEPVRFTANVLAGRLSEQAIKIGALIALSNQRLVVERSDLEIAYRIRENLYHRAAALIDESGAISGLHETTKAVEQLTAAFQRLRQIPRAHLQNHSRPYRKLDVRTREAVVRALLDAGVCVVHPIRRGLLCAVDIVGPV